MLLAALEPGRFCLQTQASPSIVAEAHGSLGGFRVWHEFEWSGAESEFRRAVRGWQRQGLAGIASSRALVRTIMGSQIMRSVSI
jgi:hypothetical protein